ncbi:MAG: tRNA (guanosine(37)-N1)-methyltransferase TrmD [Lachnospiraceae bacterium]|nr:tRNA (guanosine(37)-N1)-methyltransferase TrmD [Lachnospiraceae bacterium]
MKYHILTLFPELISAYMDASILGRACENGILSYRAVNIRDYSLDKHKKVDDYPYGGGPGMVMQAQPIYDAWSDVISGISGKPRCIYLTPQGRTFDQDMAKELAKEEDLVFLCGHYEGVDERVLDKIVTDPVSAGDFVLTGGELPALMMIDAISRMIPGVLGNEVSGEGESFENGLLEYPQFSRPECWMGEHVPDVLLSGDHERICSWRREESLKRTVAMRPDLLKEADLTREEISQILKHKNRL